MKFLCDVHIPLQLAKHITQKGFECIHVNNILDGFFTKDSDISKFVDQNKLILITKDRDFKNSFLLKGIPARLIKINLGNVSNDRLIGMLEQHLVQIQKFYDDFDSFMIELEPDGTLTVTK